MPRVFNNEILAKAFLSASKKIDQNRIPTLLLQSGRSLYRSFNPASPHSLLPKPAPGGVVSKDFIPALLIPGDGYDDRNNRFSGPELSVQLREAGLVKVPGAGGLYCVLQQQAVINEMMHYTGKPGKKVLEGRCVIRIQLMRPMMMADLSPHNPDAKKFLRDLAVGTWDRMSDPDDCSVARGIGLAIANSPKLNGLIAQTVRESERSAEERGDNLVLFAAPAASVAHVSIDTAYYFGPAGMETFRVEPLGRA